MCSRSRMLYVFLRVWVLSLFSSFFTPFQRRLSQFSGAGHGKSGKKTQQLLSCFVDCDTFLSLPHPHLASYLVVFLLADTLLQAKFL